MENFSYDHPYIFGLAIFGLIFVCFGCLLSSPFIFRVINPTSTSQVGVISAIDKSSICDVIFVKPDLSSTQEDAYEVRSGSYEEFETLLGKSMLNKVRLEIKFRETSDPLCQDSIVSVREV